MTDVVTREEFARIKCNGCGDCCERFYLPKPTELAPFLDWLSVRCDVFDDEEARKHKKAALWFADVIPLDEEFTNEGKMMATCARFQRVDKDHGICTAYEQRPYVCSDFPYGRPVDSYGDRCSFNVSIIEG